MSLSELLKKSECEIPKAPNDNKSETLPPISQREHMGRPYPGGNYDCLLINVPSTFQQGIIPDGEELPHGLLRIISVARHLHERVPSYPVINAGILDAHRLRLSPEEIEDQIRKTGARIVGLNPTSLNVREAQVIAKICDQLNVPYIIGGVHATLSPEVAYKTFPTASVIVRGRGEYLFPILVDGILNNKPPRMSGVYYPDDDYNRSDYASGLDLERIPLPRQDIYAENPLFNQTVNINGCSTQISEANLFVTYGCPFECVFCASPILVNRGKGSKPYQRPEMEHILDEITHVVCDLGANAIHFLDDMAFVTPQHVKDLYEGLSNRDLAGHFIWRGLTRASIINRFDEETMQIMKASGAWKIALGIESGSDEVLRMIKKKVTTTEVTMAVRKLVEFGIQVKGFFIMGFPGETESQILETRRFIQRLKEIGMTEISVFQFKPYPGTEAFNELIRKNPEIIQQLDYLHLPGLSQGTKAERRIGPQVWLSDDIRIAEIPSGKVREHVIAAIEDFYG